MKRKRSKQPPATSAPVEEILAEGSGPVAVAPGDDEAPSVKADGGAEVPADAPRRSRGRKKASVEEPSDVSEVEAPADATEDVADEASPRRSRGRRKKADDDVADVVEAAADGASGEVEASADDARPRRSRGRRKNADEAVEDAADEGVVEASTAEDDGDEVAAGDVVEAAAGEAFGEVEASADDARPRRSRGRRKKADGALVEASTTEDDGDEVATSEVGGDEVEPSPAEDGGDEVEASAEVDGDEASPAEDGGDEVEASAEVGGDEVEASAEVGDEVQASAAVDGGDVEASAVASVEMTESADVAVGSIGAETANADEAEPVEGAAVLPTSASSMDDAQLKTLVEALVFASDKPLTVQRLRQLTRVSDTRRLEAALAQLADDYLDRGLVLQQVSGGFQFRTRTQWAPWVQQLVAGRPVRLTRAQLETLAIVAYRQPITRPEIDDIRGVDSSATLKLLLDRTLIRILGKKEEVGRPMLYGTTKEFLDFFSLGDLRELPTLREYSELTDESRRVISDRLGLEGEGEDGGSGSGGDGGGGGGDVGGGGGGDDGDGGGRNDGGDGGGGGPDDGAPYTDGQAPSDPFSEMSFTEDTSDPFAVLIARADARAASRGEDSADEEGEAQESTGEDSVHAADSIDATSDGPEDAYADHQASRASIGAAVEAVSDDIGHASQVDEASTDTSEDGARDERSMDAAIEARDEASDATGHPSHVGDEASTGSDDAPHAGDAAVEAASNTESSDPALEADTRWDIGIEAVSDEDTGHASHVGDDLTTDAAVEADDIGRASGDEASHVGVEAVSDEDTGHASQVRDELTTDAAVEADDIGHALGDEASHVGVEAVSDEDTGHASHVGDELTPDAAVEADDIGHAHELSTVAAVPDEDTGHGAHVGDEDTTVEAVSDDASHVGDVAVEAVSDADTGHSEAIEATPDEADDASRVSPTDVRASDMYAASTDPTIDDGVEAMLASGSGAMRVELSESESSLADGSGPIASQATDEVEDEVEDGPYANALADLTAAEVIAVEADGRTRDPSTE